MPFARLKRVAAASLFSCAAAAIGPAGATVIADSASLPLLNVPYQSPTGAGCFPLANVCVTPGVLTLTSTLSSVFSAAGQDILADATYSGVLTNALTGNPIGPFTLTGTVEELVEGRTSDSELGAWETELLLLNMSGPVLGHTLTLGLDPSHPSIGATSIAPLGGATTPQFRITSFFDVFVELSLDAIPPLSASVGPISVSVGIPEPATWALLSVGMATLALAGAARGRTLG